jgi:hypothetical protein
LIHQFKNERNTAMTHTGLSAADRADLTRLEEAMWREETRYGLTFQQTHFANDFFEFGRSGRVYSRDQIIQTQGHTIQAKLPLPDLQIRLLDANTVQVTYNSEVIHKGITEYARRSSIWSRTPAGWVMRFHQGTACIPTSAE